jgi:hypothetical protein
MAKRAIKGKRIRGSPEDLARLQAFVLGAVRSNRNQRLEEIGRAMKSDRVVLKRPVVSLLAAKQLRTKKRKRATICFEGSAVGGARSTRP